MFRSASHALATLLISSLAAAQQPSGTSAAPAPGTHMDQSTVQTVGTTPNGAGATTTRPQPSANTPPTVSSPDAGTGNSLVANPPQPVTKTLGGGGLVDPNDVADLLAPKPLQPSKLSLIGGTVKSIDQIRDNMTVRVYDAGTMKVKFDQRTHFYRDGKETTQLTVKKGDRVYLDTQLFEGKVFAKNVHVESGSRSADASGQIVSFNPNSGDMVVQDQLAGSTVRFRVDPQTTIKQGDAKTTASALRPGSLIAVKFSPRSRNAGAAEEVSIIAAPGTSFTYFGRVTHLDLHAGLLAIENQADGKVYDIHFDSSTRIPENLTVGSQVTAVAMFRGHDYVAQSVEVNSGPDRAAMTEAEENATTAADTEKHGKKDRSKEDRSKKDKDRDKDDDQL
jgi:hypothetical protein